MLSEAAASQPMKPEPITIAERASCARGRKTRASCSERRLRISGSSAPGTGRPHRLGARGEHARVVGERAAAGQPQGPAAGIERLDRGFAAQLDALLGEPVLLLERGLVGLAAQQLLRQQRAHVRRVGLGGQQRHRPGAARLAVRARGLQAGRTAADDGQPAHATSKRSRAYSGVRSLRAAGPKRAASRSWTSSPVSG
jgi:hypothetical protein